MIRVGFFSEDSENESCTQIIISRHARRCGCHDFSVDVFYSQKAGVVPKLLINDKWPEQGLAMTDSPVRGDTSQALPHCRANVCDAGPAVRQRLCSIRFLGPCRDNSDRHNWSGLPLPWRGPRKGQRWNAVRQLNNAMPCQRSIAPAPRSHMALKVVFVDWMTDLFCTTPPPGQERA